MSGAAAGGLPLGAVSTPGATALGGLGGSLEDKASIKLISIFPTQMLRVVYNIQQMPVLALLPNVHHISLNFQSHFDIIEDEFFEGFFFLFLKYNIQIIITIHSLVQYSIKLACNL